MRPTHSVSACSRARLGQRGGELARRAARSAAPARCSCSASAVSSTSEDVRPKWIQRPAGPADAPSTSTNAATSWSVTRSRSLTASTVNVAARIASSSSARRRPVPPAPRPRRPRRRATRSCAPRRSRRRRARGGCIDRSRRGAYSDQPPQGAPRACRCWPGALDSGIGRDERADTGSQPRCRALIADRRVVAALQLARIEDCAPSGAHAASGPTTPRARSGSRHRRLHRRALRRPRPAPGRAHVVARAASSPRRSRATACPTAIRAPAAIGVAERAGDRLVIRYVAPRSCQPRGASARTSPRGPTAGTIAGRACATGRPHGHRPESGSQRGRGDGSPRLPARSARSASDGIAIVTGRHRSPRPTTRSRVAPARRPRPLRPRRRSRPRERRPLARDPDVRHRREGADAGRATASARSLPELGRHWALRYAPRQDGARPAPSAPRPGSRSPPGCCSPRWRPGW